MWAVVMAVHLVDWLAAAMADEMVAMWVVVWVEMKAEQ